MNTERSSRQDQDSKDSRRSDPERAWIEGSSKGDADAFRGLYDRYAGGVYTMAMRMTNDASVAEDVTQEVFLVLWKKVATFKGTSKFSTWLFGIAMNGCLAQLRRTRSQAEAAREMTYAREMHCFAPAGNGPSRDRQLELKQAISALPEGYRSAVVLHDVLGFSHEEIGGMRGCSTGTSRSQLAKARSRLREALDPGRGFAHSEERS